MKFLTAFVLAATCLFAEGLRAQESSQITPPVGPAHPASAPVSSPASVPATVSAPVAPLAPVVATLPFGPLSRAEVATTGWLAAADAGDYARSWREAAGLLQNSVTQAQWERALQTNRLPRGSVKSRTLKAATYSLTLPGAPDGEYMFIQYETRFEFNSVAIETLTAMKDRDNTWKVAGYFIR